MISLFSDSDTSYRWGQVALCLVTIFFTCLILFGCDSEADIRQKQQEAVQRIANACVPEVGEEKVLRWTVGAEGKLVLYITVRKLLGERGRTVQYIVISEDEIQ